MTQQKLSLILLIMHFLLTKQAVTQAHAHIHISFRDKFVVTHNSHVNFRVPNASET
jgi:hypothetical protein